MQISSEFRDMLSSLLPSVSEQEAFFASFQQALKKSISINRHREKLKGSTLKGGTQLIPNNKELIPKNKELIPNFENNNPDFILSQTPFDEFGDTKYVDREDTTIALGKTRQHLTGEFYIQEVAASLPANILKSHFPSLLTDNAKPLTILDVCAAPGGKTAQLADFLLAHHIPGIVWGNDIDAKRLSTRASNIQRCGLYNTVATKLDGSQIGNLYPEFFDAILVDAPCSGEGTGFKSDAAYKRRKQESINKIVGLQENIVTSAIKACKPGGIVIYSTCTINPFENELQIAKLLEKYGDALEILPIEVANKSEGIMVNGEGGMVNNQEKIIHNSSFTIHNFLRARPHIHHTGGFFVCVLRKTKSTLNPLQEHISNKKSYSHLGKGGQGGSSKQVTTPYMYSNQTEKTVRNVLFDYFGIELDLNNYAIIEGKHKMNLTDASVREIVKSGVRLHECGIPILKPTGKTFSVEHECAIALGHLATKNTIEITTDELQRYALGEDLLVSNTPQPLLSLHSSQSTPSTSQLLHSPTSQLCNGYIILIHDGLGVGVGKIVNGMIKNKFFKR